MEPVTPRLTGVVVHWRALEDLRELIAAWPDEADYELLVVDNSGEAGESFESGRARLLRPGRNLGFAGGVNLGLEQASAPWILLLNPDARPEPGALTELVRATQVEPRAAGFAPRLLGADGQPQFGWQLRPLPRLDQLLRQAFFFPGPRGPRREPAAGVAVEQPAAAALLLSRDVLRALGGFDEAFFPAWFEDVDFARRLRAIGGTLLYWPSAVVSHQLGGSVGVLGYRGFLLAYGRNLHRYVAKHHGAVAAGSLRILMPLGALLRLLALPLRRPRRAASRAAAAAALWALAGAALAGFPKSAR